MLLSNSLYAEAHVICGVFNKKTSNHVLFSKIKANSEKTDQTCSQKLSVMDKGYMKVYGGHEIPDTSIIEMSCDGFSKKILLLNNNICSSTKAGAIYAYYSSGVGKSSYLRLVRK